jgi:hypothetical protein
LPSTSVTLPHACRDGFGRGDDRVRPLVRHQGAVFVIGPVGEKQRQSAEAGPSPRPVCIRALGIVLALSPLFYLLARKNDLKGK